MAVDVGGGFTHVEGEKWDDADWDAFEAWAIQNGAHSGRHCGFYSVAWYAKIREHGECLHRLFAPAIVNKDGSMEWYQEGVEVATGE
jgi:hypothetical protein